MQLRASDRVKFVTNPLALPAICVVCGAHADGNRKFVDFNFNIDYFGAVYFCSGCVVNVMFGLGYVKEEELDHANGTIDVLQNKVEDLVTENGKLFSALNSLTGLGISSLATGQDVEESNSETRSDDSESDGNEPDTPEQVTIPGLENISNSTSDDQKSVFAD